MNINVEDFDTSWLDPHNTVVRCATQEEADIFLEYLKIKGVRTNIKKLKELWYEHGSSTCYHLSETRWCYDSWYEENCPSICIVDFCDIYTPRAESNNITYSYEELFE